MNKIETAVNINDEETALFRLIGGGNYSKGIRIALESEKRNDKILLQRIEMRLTGRDVQYSEAMRKRLDQANAKKDTPTLQCGGCGYQYRPTDHTFKRCPECGAKGPGHPDMELKDVE